MQLAQSGQIVEAISSLRSILTTHGNDATVHHSLGFLQFQTGALEQAMFHFDKARQLDSRNPDFQSDYGTALNISGHFHDATAAFRRAVALDAKSFPGQLGLSSSLYGSGEYEAAVETARIASTLAPNRAEPRLNLSLALAKSGRTAEAVQSLREALAVIPGHPMLLNQLAINLIDRPEATPQDIFQAHQQLGQTLSANFGGGIRSFNNDPSPDRPLNIGYVSSDLKEGPTASFLGPVLAAHDRGNFRTFCYSVTTNPDATTERLKSLAWNWKDVLRLSDGPLAQLIISDRIDVLIDLSGHFPGGRIGAFVSRAAPVQVSWFGYPASTGLKSIGYRLADSATDPEGAESLHTEKLIRLDNCFICFQPSAHAPDVAARTDRKAITFASFNAVRHWSEQTIETWSAILRGLPGSRLILSGDALSDEATARRFADAFSGFGLGPDRVELRPAGSETDRLAAYGEVDIALDTFPYSGFHSVCEALDMGVPVITLTGPAHAGRTGTSILRTIGLESLAAATTGDYIRIASDLARDPARLNSMRTGQRARLRNAPLCNAPAFTRQLESAYREMWRSWGSNLLYT